jgi:glutathione S-transferase
MLNLYDSRNSGNGWKVRLLLSHLGMPFTRHVLNLAAGEARTPEFLKLNPLARVPVLVLDDGTAVCESNAILLYLAQGSAYLPTDRKVLALVWQWLFFEQYDHLKNFARPRFLISIAKTAAAFGEEI